VEYVADGVLDLVPSGVAHVDLSIPAVGLGVDRIEND